MDLQSYADELSDMFMDQAETVRAYWRQHVADLPPAQEQQLRQRIIALETLHDQFCAEGIAESLAKVQDKLQNLRDLTTQADVVLRRLQQIQQVTMLTTALLEAGSAAACGDIPGTAEKLGALAQALIKSKQPAAAVQQSG